MKHDKIQTKGYKHICDRCKCDSGGAQCQPFLQQVYEEANDYDMSYYCQYQYEPSCTIAIGHMCSYYYDKYIKPRINEKEY